jgi:hypothetical protein
MPTLTGALCKRRCDTKRGSTCNWRPQPVVALAYEVFLMIKYWP